MFWNHDTPTEEAGRPEGDLSRLAAVTVSLPRWEEAGPEGPGMYTDARVFAGYAEAVDQIAEHIGVSIRGMGTQTTGTAEGRDGVLVGEITQGKSIDFVTAPGAGGAILKVFESAPDAVKLPALVVIEEQDDMSEKDDKGKNDDKGTAVLESSVRELAKTIAGLQQELSAQTANGMVIAALAEAELPELVATRLTKQLVVAPPMKDKQLDEAAFGDEIEAAITEAQAEIVAITGKQATIAGQGESDSTDKWPTFEESRKRQDSVLAELGYGGSK
jgi:hypothetical protein